MRSEGSAPGLTLRQSVSIPLENNANAGEFCTFDGFQREEEHFAVRFPGLNSRSASTLSPLVRIHSECVTGDAFGSVRCDCGLQLQEAIRTLSAEGGYILYLRQEGRGIGFVAKMDAYRQQDLGFDTYEANAILGHAEDDRSYAPAAAMLQALGEMRIRLLTNNPCKVKQLQDLGVDIEDVVPTGVYVTDHNRKYLESKRLRHGHTLGEL